MKLYQSDDFLSVNSSFKADMRLLTFVPICTILWKLLSGLQFAFLFVPWGNFCVVVFSKLTATLKAFSAFICFLLLWPSATEVNKLHPNKREKINQSLILYKEMLSNFCLSSRTTVDIFFSLVSKGLCEITYERKGGIFWSRHSRKD